MRQDEIINGYRILRDFSSAGGGKSKWTFAEKDGREYFIKEFLFPTYPLAGSPGSERVKTKKRAQCDLFESHQRSMMKAINTSSAPGGNLVSTIEFFRWGAKYFKVTDKVDVTGLKPVQIASLPKSQRILIMTTIAHSLRILHNQDIVHGDIKLDNVLIKQTRLGSYTAKLIDFDDSYFDQKPLSAEEIVGDQVFYSPELARYIRNDPKITGEDLTLKSDIFALGLLYNLYFLGKLPLFDRKKFQYPWRAVNAGAELKIDASAELSDPLKELFIAMLEKRAEDRPNVDDIFSILKVKIKVPPKPDISKLPKPKQLVKHVEEEDDSFGHLKGKMMYKPPVEKETKVIRYRVDPVEKREEKEEDHPGLRGTLLWKKKDKKE